MHPLDGLCSQDKPAASHFSFAPLEGPDGLWPSGLEPCRWADGREPGLILGLTPSLHQHSPAESALMPMIHGENRLQPPQEGQAGPNTSPGTHPV